MAHSYLTTSDVAIFGAADMEGVISDVLDEAPLLQVLAARQTMGITFTYNKKTANPAVGFRSANDGTENTKATRSAVTVNLGILDASFAVDMAVANADELGWQHVMALEAQDHLRQAMKEVEEQILNGTVGNQASPGFDGFADQTNLDGASDAMVVNAAGTTASTGSSVYGIRTGQNDVEVIWGQQGKIAVGERQIVERAGSSTGLFPAYYHPINGWTGLKIGSSTSVGRIGNLTEDAGKGLTDDLVAELLNLFPAGGKPNYLAMNGRSLEQLRASRTATNPTGAPAPFPTEAFGVPIVVTDSLGVTETLLS